MSYEQSKTLELFSLEALALARSIRQNAPAHPSSSLASGSPDVKPEPGKQRFNARFGELVAVLGVDRFAAAKTMRRPSMCTVCAARLSRCISMRLSAAFQRAGERSIEIEVGIEFAVQTREDVLVEGGGDTRRVIVGGEQFVDWTCFGCRAQDRCPAAAHRRAADGRADCAGCLRPPPARSCRCWSRYTARGPCGSPAGRWCRAR